VPSRATASSEREALRIKFRPKHLRLLFIGESPPASGRFFYQKNSGLYRAMRGAFHIAAPPIDDRNFLETFQASGCYLIDLCPEPVDRLAATSRRTLCRNNESALSRMIVALQPSIVATLLRSIETNVSRAISNSRWRGPCLHLPYPGRWHHHRAVFVETLVPAIRDLIREKRGAV
jgi:hypothetical protein